MSRTVLSTYVQPGRDTHPHTEVGDPAWQALAEAANTLWEHLRGTLVCEWDPGGVLTSTSQTAWYRLRTWGLTGTTYLARVYVHRTISFGSGTVRVDSTGAADFVSASLGSGSATGWVDVGTLSLDASTEYETVEVQLSAASNCTVEGIVIIPERALSVLAAASGGFAYDDGFTPLEVTDYGGEMPLTASKGRILSDCLRALWETRLSQVCATAYAVTPLASAVVGFGALKPHHLRSGLTGTLRCHVRYRWTGSGVGYEPGTVSLAGGGGSGFILATSGGTATWGTIDLDIALPSQETPQPQIAEMTLSVTGDLELHAISAYWRDLTYG